MFLKGIAMSKPPIVKEREKNAKKLTTKNVLNDQKIMKFSKILKFYILNPKLQGEIFKLAVLQQKDHLKILKTEMIFFILIGKGSNSS